MNESRLNDLTYSLFDPTGNITALVDSEVAVEEQPAVADLIMRKHPEVEQVGFVTFPGGGGARMSGGGHGAADGEAQRIDGELRMAGGEFCGNASMCAAALCLIRQRETAASDDNAAGRIRVRVSGAADPVDVRLKALSDVSFTARVTMPPCLAIENRRFVVEDVTGVLPVVRMEGISHIIIEEASGFFSLKNDAAAAEYAVRKWCQELGADGLGLMFLEAADSRELCGKAGNGPNESSEEGADAAGLTPLVYIPGSGTVFWENSCASGSSAAGMYLAERNVGAADGGPGGVTVLFREPGGSLCVESSKAGTYLTGAVRLTGQSFL